MPGQTSRYVGQWEEPRGNSERNKAWNWRKIVGRKGNGEKEEMRWLVRNPKIVERIVYREERACWIELTGRVGGGGGG